MIFRHSNRFSRITGARVVKLDPIPNNNLLRLLLMAQLSEQPANKMKLDSSKVIEQSIFRQINRRLSKTSKGTFKWDIPKI